MDGRESTMKAVRNSATLDSRQVPRAATPDVACPECGATFPLTEALTQQARDRLAMEYDARRKEDRVAVEAAVRQELAGEVGELQEQLDHKDAVIKEFRQAEVALRRSQRALTEAQENHELEVERRVGAVTKEIETQARQRADERYGLQLAEKEKQIQAVQAKLEEATRKAEQGSQERQGAVQQEALHQILTERFSSDVVAPVGRGRAGADVIQRVATTRGQDCGVILWESKRAQSWVDGWVDKLKADQRRLGADLAVVVASKLPKGAERIDHIKGVWVTDLASAPQLARVLRESLIALAHLRASAASKSDLMGEVYDYVTGPAFIQHIKAMLEAMTRMEAELVDERAAHERLWAKREKDHRATVTHLARMVGDFQGLGAGLALPRQLALQPPADA